MRKIDGKKGFTLLELLVVVIIVSILAAVALPRFTKMTRKARSTEGATAVGAMLTAEFLYYQEANPQTFSTSTADLLVDFNTVNFSYSVVSGGASTAVVRASGVAGQQTSGIIVNGTVDNAGARTVTTSGI